MIDSLIPNNSIPNKFEFECKTWIVYALNKNLYYRAIAFPIGGGDPRWFSNNELNEIISVQKIANKYYGTDKSLYETNVDK